MKKLIIGNWKMNPESLEDAKGILKKISQVIVNSKKTEVCVAPPFVFLEPISKIAAKNGILLVAQDVSRFDDTDTAKTGEVSLAMLKKAGVSMCIVGHSERRNMGEDDATVAVKVKKIIKSGLVPIVCVGEKIREDHGEYLAFITTQIKNSLAQIAKKDSKKIVVAYEPVWAIGAPAPMDPKDVQESLLFVRKVLADIFGSENAFKIPILYGGAVNPRNAKDIVEIGETDGLLIGRESLNKEAFAEIIKEIG